MKTFTAPAALVTATAFAGVYKTVKFDALDFCNVPFLGREGAKAALEKSTAGVTLGYVLCDDTMNVPVSIWPTHAAAELAALKRINENLEDGYDVNSLSIAVATLTPEIFAAHEAESHEFLVSVITDLCGDEEASPTKGHLKMREQRLKLVHRYDLANFKSGKDVSGRHSKEMHSVC